jgi:ferredoxin--NADP+ reductase
MVNSPDSRPLEFYYIEVPNGQFTTNLSTLKSGDEILVAPKAHGFMTLDMLPQSKHLWMLATGTGVGPFLSILATDKPWIRFERVILVYAVRHVSELSYQTRIAQIFSQHSKQFSFIPFVSRETVDLSLTGRIPQAILDGRLQMHAGIEFSADNSQVMICGNPQMVRDTSNVLIGRGLKKHHRFDPGHITIENYW